MNSSRQKKSRRWIGFVIAGIVLIIIIMVLLSKGATARLQTASYKTVNVETGSITKVVTATGTLEAQDTLSYSIAGGIKIDKVFVKAGDSIKTGQVMASLNRDILLQCASTLNNEINQLDMQLLKLSRQSLSDDIRTPVEGRVKQIFAKTGGSAAETIAQNGTLIMLSTDEKMKVVFSTKAKLDVNQKINVQFEDGTKTDGTILSKSDDGTVCSATIDDKNGEVGQKVSVYNQTLKIGEGTLEINKPFPIIATGGTVKTIHVKQNEKVSANDVLITLKDLPSTSSYDSKYLERQTKAADYAEILQYIQYPMITAPADGVISELNIEDDMQLLKETVIAKVDTNSFKLVVKVDELDIPSIKIGQQALVTLDAIPDKEIPASLVKISTIGDVKSGVTTYQATLDFKTDDTIYKGMNATANITIDKKDNILFIPLDALQESDGETFVNMYNGKQGDLGEKRIVRTGISDSKYVQIIEGLNAGDQITYKLKTTNQTAQGLMFNRFQQAARTPSPTGGQTK